MGCFRRDWVRAGCNPSAATGENVTFLAPWWLSVCSWGVLMVSCEPRCCTPALFLLISLCFPHDARSCLLTAHVKKLSVFFFFLNFSPALYKVVLGFFLWPCHTACEILVPQPGFKPVSPAVKTQSSNHWTAREFCCLFFFLIDPSLDF